MIAFCVISTQLGGAERSLLDLLNELKSIPKEFVVITPKDQGPLIDCLDKTNIRHITLKLPSWYLKVSRKRTSYTILYTPFLILYSLLYLTKIHRLFKKENIKKVHSTGLKYHLLFGLYAKFNKTVEITIHIRDIINNSMLKKIFLFFAKSENIHFISNSRVTAQSLQPCPSKVIYNGFSPVSKNDRKASLKQTLNISETSFLVGIVGVIARWKGQREFILMAQKLLLNHQNLHFLIVGSEIYDTDGDIGELKSLKELAVNCGITENIHFLKFQKNIYDIYHGLDILVHSSIAPEPFGRVIVEAMLCGCAVTASDQAGPTEIITHNVDGLLHKPGQINSMAENVERLINDSSLRFNLSKKAKDKVKLFSMQNHLEQMKKELKL